MRVGLALLITTFSASTAVAVSTTVTPLDAVTQALVAELVDTLPERVCAPMGAVIDAQSGGAPRADLSQAQVAYRVQIRESGPKLREMCASRTREAVDAPEGPRAALVEALRPRVAAVLEGRELEQARRFLESPAARRLTPVRQAFEAEAGPLVEPWVRSFAPALYADLSLMLRAEIGAPPSTRVLEPPVPAHLRNRNLGEACADFYPQESRRRGEEGAVVLSVRVSERGRLSGVRVEASSGYPALDVAAAACIGTYGEFEPQTEGGQPVTSWQRLKWTWRLGE